MLSLLVSLSLLYGPTLGEALPPFQMLDIQNRVVAWNPGRVTVFAVCAFWCDTWRVQVPRLEATESAVKGLPVDFRTISTDGRWAEVARHNGDLTLWRDAGGSWSSATGIDRVPTIFVVNAQGRIEYYQTGIVRTSDIVSSVHRALTPRTMEAGSVYITFDDFPPANGGEILLDELRRANVPATLFCMGSRLEPNASLIQRAAREGHSIQCHSWDHEVSQPHLERCQAAFQRVLGRKFDLYRPPGKEQIVGLKRKVFVVDPYDFTRPTASEILRRTAAEVRPGCVIQLHAGVSQTLEILPELISKIRHRGFKLERLEN